MRNLTAWGLRSNICFTSWKKVVSCILPCIGVTQYFTSVHMRWFSLQQLARVTYTFCDFRVSNSRYTLFIVYPYLHIWLFFNFFKIEKYFKSFESLLRKKTLKKRGGVQNLEWSDVERPIFRDFKITNIEIAKDELFNYFICEFIFYYYFFKVFDNFSKLYNFSKLSKLLNFWNFMIFQIKK